MKNHYCQYLKHLSILTILGACATVPKISEYWQPYTHQNIDFHASGRLSVKMGNRGSHGNFSWENQYSNHFHLIDIKTPIGNTIGQLCKDTSRTVARNNKNQIFVEERSLELSEKLLGFPVPLDYLDLWINGYIPQQLPYKILNNKLYQDNWIIERKLDPDQIPKKITLTRKDLSITIVVDEFSKYAVNNHQDLICPSKN